MALNFPVPTSVGQVYQDPTSGNTYVCTSLGPPAQWVGSGSSTSLDSTYLRNDTALNITQPATFNVLEVTGQLIYSGLEDVDLIELEISSPSPNQLLNELDTTVFRSCEYTVQVSQANSQQVSQLLLLHNNGISYLSVTNTIFSPSDDYSSTFGWSQSNDFYSEFPNNLGQFSTIISNNQAQLLFTPRFTSAMKVLISRKAHKLFD